MKLKLLLFLLIAGLAMPSCVSKKKFRALESDLAKANEDLGKCGVSLNDYMARLSTCQQELRDAQNTGQTRQDQLADLRAQLDDCKAQRDKQLNQVGDLTVLSQSANENIKETLRQLEQKEKYIHLLQAAKSKADSINLALSANLKTVLRDGIEDKDVEIKIDKTVVFINLSDKMLFQSGKYVITPKANEVLGKIAQIVASRPDLQVMVEGYTDNVPIKTNCIDDNWDLSVKRATSVVRALQVTHKVDPNRLVAAGRGEWNILASNDTPDGRQTNRRTRIIIMPKLDQFYDLLNPNNVPK
ncbi:MAG: OmpA family protein [Bacteroidota bacterium]